MLPLHITFKNLVYVSFSLVIILASCSDRSKADLEIVNVLDESLASSNKAIAQSSEDVLISLKDKLNDYGTREFASRWYPKAERIQQLSKEAYNQIEKIKINLDNGKRKIFVNDSSDLFEMLINYKKNVLLIDPTVTNQFEKTFRLFTESLDSIKNNQRDLLKNYFDGASLISIKAMLSKLQNNIRVNEERMIIFCHEQIATHPLIYDYIQAIVLMNSSVVQPKEQIEITAGILSFTGCQKPEVFVYGKSVTLGEDAFAHYKLKSASKPGKYYIPVKINYTDQNGLKQSIQKEIEYTVANIQKQ